ncbi:YqjF family protein [Halomicroarcula sp. GCM10025817]|uniref:YqjF family protein n=1 Tax=Haloarcula TaxID=2237 RepID=UPI0023E79762|nr:DUF2071 domain-containing protein [Halomicroarcula sp. SYNS111]
MDILRMRWRDVGFLHWPVDPSVVAETLPDPLTVDTYDGDAYLGVVPFRMADIRPRGSPVGRSFGELNLRTYVRAGGTPGVYFYNLDADDALSVRLARRLFMLPYYSASMRVESRDGRVRFQSERPGTNGPTARFDVTYEGDGAPSTPDTHSLEQFLVERYRFYASAENGQVYYADINHEPWPLEGGTADVRRNELFDVNGFEYPDGDPLVHYSEGIDVSAGVLHRL